MPEANLQREIHKLVRTIHKRMSESRNGWVTWDQVARWQTGATVSAPYLSSLASLPEYKSLFCSNNTAVRLSSEGIQLALALPQEERTVPGLVASAVIEYARGLRPIRFEVNHVSTVAPVGNKVVQALYVDLTDDLVPSETPVKVYPANSSSVHGKIVGQEQDGGVFYVALDCELLPVNLPATLLIDRAYLLTELANQLQTLQDFPERMQSLLLELSGVPLVADDDSTVVARKLADLQPPWTRFLWGPPGAGKTYGLGQFMIHLLRSEPQNSILIVAPSNRAVDVATGHLRTRLAVNGMDGLIGDRKILRFGYPRKTEIIERPELLGPKQLDELNQRVKEVSHQILKAEQDRLADAELAVLRTQLLAAQEAVKQAVDTHVQQCSVVATTTTLAYMPTSPVGKKMWDTVIVDEATMVAPAICTFLASKARKRLLVAGDPRQLGPVYEEHGPSNEETRYWLGRDLFEVSRVSSGEMENRQIRTDDARLTRITTQRRCATEIWTKVTHLYPEVKNAANPDRLRTLADLPPCPGNSVVLLDVSGSIAKCEQVRGSWQNIFTAELALEVAATIASEAAGTISIAIISPYRAQVRLLRRWIREEKRADTTPFKRTEVEAGTVHQFQGSEADIVIFDMVDGVGRAEVGKLLREDTGIRLVNVAITRARGKLIVIADRTWCARSHLDRNNSLLEHLIFGRTTVKQIQVVPPPAPSGNRQTGDDGTESPIEKLLLDAMRKHPALCSVQTQHTICDENHRFVSRADFAFPEIKYAVYCDGKQWHLQQDRWQRDLRQRNALTALGWAFSVFSGREVNQGADKCAAQVVKTHQMRSTVSAGGDK